jgi:hypothetical protein
VAKTVFFVVGKLREARFPHNKRNQASAAGASKRS